MDVSEYRIIMQRAISSEIEAQEFYKYASESVENSYLKDMFSQFFDEEQRHQKTLEKILTSDSFKKHFREEMDYMVSETTDLPKLSINMKPADAIALAMKKEETAMKHYTRLAEASIDPNQKAVFEDLAAMERGHKFKMEKAFVDIGYPEVW